MPVHVRQPGWQLATQHGSNERNHGDGLHHGAGDNVWDGNKGGETKEEREGLACEVGEPVGV